MKIALLSLLTTCLLAATPGDPVKVDFQVLSNFEYSQGCEIPANIAKYHKKRITVGGFMNSEDDSTGEVDFFILVNDACGCEGTPKLNEMIFCSMPEGETVALKPGTAWVTGKLYIEEEIDEGVVVSLYTMEVEKVK